MTDESFRMKKEEEVTKMSVDERLKPIKGY